MAGLPLRVVSGLWNRLNHIYGHRWESSYGPALNEHGELNDAAATWAKALGPCGPDDLARGLRACLNRVDGWPPTLPEFRELCQAPQPLAPYHVIVPPALPEPDHVKAARKAKAKQVLGDLKAMLRGTGGEASPP